MNKPTTNPLSPRPRQLCIAFLLVCVILMLFAGCDQKEATGDQAADFTLTDLEGNSVTLSDLRGQAVFLNFWATWCAPCRSEMPAMQEIHDEYHDQGLVVLGIGLADTESAMRQFIQAEGYTWTFALDTSGTVADTYGVSGIPASFFIDEDGFLTDKHVGPMSKSAMESAVQNILP